MSRSPTSGIAGVLSNTVVQSGYLVQVTVNTTPIQTNVYMSSFDTDFIFNSQTWSATDIVVNGVNWQTGGVQSGTVEIEDNALVWWGYAVNLLLQDMPVSIWAAYVDAPTEAEPLWTGRIGKAAQGKQSIILSVVPDNQVRLVPFKRVQSIIPSQYLMPAGTIINIAGQQWVLQRK